MSLMVSPLDLLVVVPPTPEWICAEGEEGSFCHGCNFDVFWGAKACGIGEYPFAMLQAYITADPNDAHTYWEDALKYNTPPGMVVEQEGFLGDESIMYLLDPGMGPPENNCVMTFRMGNICIYMFTGQTGASSELAWFFADQIVENIGAPWVADDSKHIVIALAATVGAGLVLLKAT